MGSYTDPENTKWATYAFICIFCAAYAATWAPGPWAVTGDAYGNDLRAWGIAFSTAANWGANAIITIMTPFLVDKQYGALKSKIFFIWMSFNALCFVFTYFEVYETKGLTLEQVERMIISGTEPRNSNAWAKEELAKNGTDEEIGGIIVSDKAQVEAAATPPTTNRSSQTFVEED